MRGCEGHNDSARLKIIREITRIMSWNESEPTTQTPGTRLERSKNPPPGTIIVHKTPPLGTKQGVRSPTPGT